MMLKLHDAFSYFKPTKLLIEALNKSNQVLLRTLNSPCNLHMIAYSKIKDSTLDFEGDLVEKKNSIRIMKQGMQSSERMKKRQY